MGDERSGLKSMPLYREVDRVFNELAEAGIELSQSLEAAQLAEFDQYHYHGAAAVDCAIDELGITSGNKVLDIGSGIGGPARQIAASTAASVTAIELQSDLHDTACELTRRCDLSQSVDHINTDVLAFDPEEACFQAIVSWLAFFHITDRAGLLARCNGWLEPGGKLYVEDLYARGEPAAREQEELHTILYSRYLVDRDRYEQDFLDAGFTELAVVDMTADWREFTRIRYDAFCRDRARHVRVHGVDIVNGLELFYQTVARLFEGGNLGGIRLVAQKR